MNCRDWVSFDSGKAETDGRGMDRERHGQESVAGKQEKDIAVLYQLGVPFSSSV